MQQTQVVVGVVEDDLYRLALQQLAQLRRRSDRERVDDRTLLPRRDLEQVDAVEKAMKARAFGIEGELFHVGYFGEKAVYLGYLVEVKSALRLGGGHHHII